MKALATLALLAIACRMQTSVLSPHQLAAHAGALVASEDDVAIVAQDGKAVAVDADRQVEVHIKDVDGDTLRPMQLSIRDLVAGCVDDPERPGCLATRAPAYPGIEYKQLVFDKERTASLIAVGLVGGALGYAISVAGDDEDLATVGYVGGGFVLGFGLLVLVYALH